MEGFRLLQAGEMVEAGDEYFDDILYKWMPSSRRTTVESPDYPSNIKYRRKLSSDILHNLLTAYYDSFRVSEEELQAAIKNFEAESDKMEGQVLQEGACGHTKFTWEKSHDIFKAMCTHCGRVVQTYYPPPDIKAVEQELSMSQSFYKVVLAEKNLLLVENERLREELKNAQSVAWAARGTKIDAVGHAKLAAQEQEIARLRVFVEDIRNDCYQDRYLRRAADNLLAPEERAP